MDKSYSQEMVSFRRAFHKRPEEGWTEFETMYRVVSRLRELGWNVVMGTAAVNPQYVMGRNEQLIEKAKTQALSHGVTQAFLDETQGYTGCVAILETGIPGPVTMFRFDMDCVMVEETLDPSHEANVGGYASEIMGQMHACGHDGHTAVGLGVAHWVMDHKDELKGTIKLLFQPAEEGTRGGLPMSESGLLDDVDYILCGHIGTSAHLGEVGVTESGFLATQKIDITFTGKPAHAGANPEDGRSALLAACNAATTLTGIPRNGKGDTRVSVGKLVAGEGRNVVPVHAAMQIEVRASSEEVNQYMVDYVQRIVEGCAMAYDVSFSITKVGAATVLKSDPDMVQSVIDIAKSLPTVKRAYVESGVSGSEDASWLIRKVQSHGGKGAFFVFGCNHHGHHKADFSIQDEQSLPNGFAIFTKFLQLENHR